MRAFPRFRGSLAALGRSLYAMEKSRLIVPFVSRNRNRLRDANEGRVGAYGAMAPLPCSSFSGANIRRPEMGAYVWLTNWGPDRGEPGEYRSVHLSV